MSRWVCIVEGDGEVTALPLLLRRIIDWKYPGAWVEVSTPIKVKKDRFLNRPDQFSRYLTLARAKAGAEGHILVLLDADNDCPKTKGAEILERARHIVFDRKLSVVLANREFEAWFLAAAQSLVGIRGLACTAADLQIEAERPRDAKGWLNSRMPSGYGPTTDQPAFAAKLDPELAHLRSRSFRKLCKELIG